jgi:hypothetical protein
MERIAILENEAARLAELEQYMILDTNTEKPFDGLTYLLHIR